jgi:hypothetical protein
VSRPRFTSIQVTPRAGPRGSAYELSWATADATRVDIEGYGIHGPAGSVSVAFDDLPTHLLTAYGNGGAAQAHSPVTYTFEQPVVGIRLPFAAHRAVGHRGGARPRTPSPPRVTSLLAANGAPGGDGGTEGPPRSPAARPSRWIRRTAQELEHEWRSRVVPQFLRARAAENKDERVRRRAGDQANEGEAGAGPATRRRP